MRIVPGIVVVIVMLSMSGCSKPPEKPAARNALKALPSNAPPSSDAIAAEPDPKLGSPGSAKAEDPNPTELTRYEQKFDFDGCVYAIVAPANTQFKCEQSKITASAGKQFNLEIEFGKYDLQSMCQNMKNAELYEFVSETPDILIFKRKTLKAVISGAPANAFVFFMNRTFGSSETFFKYVTAKNENAVRMPGGNRTASLSRMESQAG